MKAKKGYIEDFHVKYNCAQTVLLAFCEDLGMEEALALKISTGFGGGMRQGEVCGAVTGGIMAIGLKYGQSNANEMEAKTNTNKIVKEFCDKFKAKNGTICCRDLINCNLGEEKGMNYANETGAFKNICPKMIKDSVDLLESL